MWLLLLFSTEVFGYLLILGLYGKPWQFTLHLFAGWTFGSIITGIFYFIGTIFYPLTINHTIMIITIQFMICMSIVKHLFSKYGSSIFHIQLEKSPSYYLCLGIVAIVFYTYLNDVYGNLPISMTEDARPIFAFEQSFISSVLYGVNQRRTKLFSFKDPQLMNGFFLHSTVPLLYMTGYCTLGASYKDIAYVITLMNILSLVSYLYYFSVRFTDYRFTFALCTIFNGSWIIFDKWDIPWKHFTFYYMCFSKEASFSIPMAILAISIAQNKHAMHKVLHFSAAIILLIPNLATSLSCLVVVSCFPNWLYIGWPYLFLLFPKFIGSSIKIKSYWVESQMEGMFIPEFMIWFRSFGPPFLILVCLFVLKFNAKVFHQFMAKFSAFLFLCFIRFGNDHYENCMAINAVFFPEILIYLVELFSSMHQYYHKTSRGIIACLTILTLATFCMESFLIPIRSKRVEGITLNAYEIAYCAMKETPPNAMILSMRSDYSPFSVIAGRQVVLGNIRSLRGTGADVSHSLSLLRSLSQCNQIIDIMKSRRFRYFVDDLRNPIINATYISRFNNICSNNEYVLYMMRNS